MQPETTEFTFNPVKAYQALVRSKRELASLGDSADAADQETVARSERTISFAIRTFGVWAFAVLAGTGAVVAAKKNHWLSPKPTPVATQNATTFSNQAIADFIDAERGVPGAPHPGDYIDGKVIEQTLLRDPRNQELAKNVKPAFEKMMDMWFEVAQTRGADTNYARVLQFAFKAHGKPALIGVPGMTPHTAALIQNKLDFKFCAYPMVATDPKFEKDITTTWFRNHTLPYYSADNKTLLLPSYANTISNAEHTNEHTYVMFGLHSMDMWTSLNDAVFHTTTGNRDKGYTYPDLGKLLANEITSFQLNKVPVDFSVTPETKLDDVLADLRRSANLFADTFYDSQKDGSTRELFIEAMMYRYVRLFLVVPEPRLEPIKPILLNFAKHPELLTAN